MLQPNGCFPSYSLDQIKGDPYLRGLFASASTLDIVNTSIVEQHSSTTAPSTTVQLAVVSQNELVTMRVTFPRILNCDVRFEGGKQEMLRRIHQHIGDRTIYVVINQSTDTCIFEGYSFFLAWQAWFKSAMKLEVTLEDSKDVVIADSRTAPWMDRSVELGLMTKEENDDYMDNL